jgi:hypothetical protein
MLASCADSRPLPCRGEINAIEAKGAGSLSDVFVRKFLNGFPEDWKAVLQQEFTRAHTATPNIRAFASFPIFRLGGSLFFHAVSLTLVTLFRQ